MVDAVVFIIIIFRKSRVFNFKILMQVPDCTLDTI